jgi:hypothetical protein
MQDVLLRRNGIDSKISLTLSPKTDLIFVRGLVHWRLSELLRWI